MPDTKVSALPAASLPLTGAEEVPVVQGGVSKKVAVNDLRRQPVGVTMVTLTTATAPAAASAAVNVECFSASKGTRNRLDLAKCTQVKLVAMVIANGSSATAAIKVSYATTEAATWSGTDAGASVVLGTGTAGVLRDSGWQTLAANARVDGVTVAAIVGAAFGLTAPTIGSLTVFFR